MRLSHIKHNVKGDEIVALIKCPECKAQISNKANTCPHCGYTLLPTRQSTSKYKSKTSTLKLVSGIVSIAWSIICMFSSIVYGPLFIYGMCFLVAGIVSITSRNDVGTGRSLFCYILYAVVFVLDFGDITPNFIFSVIFAVFQLTAINLAPIGHAAST